MRGKIICLKHTASEGPGTLADYFSGKYPLQVIELWDGGKLPESLSGIEAVVAMGGPMNVYEEEEYPFLKAENEFIKMAVKEGLPYLGICLGAQLLAKACGAKVKKNRVKELGWCDVALNSYGKEDRLFSGLPGKFKVFQWHGDTFDIPMGSFNLASSKLCENQALRAGRNAYGLQFHVEATYSMLAEWLKGEEAGAARAILADAAKYEGKVRENAKRVYENFERLCLKGGK